MAGALSVGSRLLHALVVLSCLLGRTAAAQDGTLPYETRFVPTGSGTLDTALERASQLRALAEPAPVDSFGLVARAAAEPSRLEEVLQAEGYWAPRIAIRIAGRPADEPGLAAGLQAAPPAGPVPVEVAVTPGPRYRLRRIELRAATPEGAAALRELDLPAGVAPGEPARADPVLDGEAALLDTLREAGHPLATMADREVVVDHLTESMDVLWVFAPGPQARFAHPAIAGDTGVNRQVIARIAGRIEGERFSPQRLERARRELIALGAFDTVRARPGDRLDAAGRLPVTFTVVDRPRNAAGFSLGYETNYGPSSKVFYERRNAFGNAELLRFEAEVARLDAAGGTSDANFRVGASLRRPALLDGATSLVLTATALRERLDAYDRDALVTAALLERPFGDRWLLRGGPSFETGQIGRRDGEMDPFTLLGLVAGVRYDSTRSLLDPRSGLRLDLTMTPFAELAEGGGFIRALGVARTYFDLAREGGTVLALRAALGSLIGADGAVPLDKRFYAGGGGSVRGYGFQSIGPRDAQGRPNGGSSLVEGSVELRQRVRGNVGLVAFLDAGTVAESGRPDFSDVRFGAGLGLRYATAIGPLRLDVGLPLSRREGDEGYGIYVGLGQAF